jgi:hypothetical protein
LGIKYIWWYGIKNIPLYSMTEKLLKRICKVLKSEMGETEHEIVYCNYRIKFRVTNVIPKKNFPAYGDKVKVNCEVISLERECFVRDEYGVTRRDSNGCAIREYRKWGGSVAISRRLNSQIRNFITWKKFETLYMVCSLTRWEVMCDKIKWSV